MIDNQDKQNNQEIIPEVIEAAVISTVEGEQTANGSVITNTGAPGFNNVIVVAGELVHPVPTFVIVNV